MIGNFNFARAPFTNERLPRLLFVAASMLVLGLTAVHGFFLTRYLLREREELDIKVDALRDELAETSAAIDRTRAALGAVRGAGSDPRTRFLVRLYRQKSFSWTGLFNELEAITPGAVRVTSIAPAFEDGEISVTLTLVGRKLQDVLEMVRRLEASSIFTTVYPLEEANLEAAGRDRTGTAATLTLDYVEPGPAPRETEPLDERAPAETDEGKSASDEEAP